MIEITMRDFTPVTPPECPPQLMEAAPDGDPQHLKVKTLEVGSITLRRPDGGAGAGISLAAMYGTTAGIWISPTGRMVKGPMVAIWASKDSDQVAIGLYHTTNHGCAIALSINDKGEPFIQLTDPKTGQCSFLGLEELQALNK